MRIGITELILIFIVALVVIGPDKLPQYAKKLGEALAQFRKASDEAASEIKKSVVDPLEEAQKPLREAMEPIEELDQALKGNVRDVQKSLRNIGRTDNRKNDTTATDLKPGAENKQGSGAMQGRTDPGCTQDEPEEESVTDKPESAAEEPKEESVTGKPESATGEPGTESLQGEQDPSEE